MLDGSGVIVANCDVETYASEIDKVEDSVSGDCDNSVVVASVGNTRGAAGFGAPSKIPTTVVAEVVLAVTKSTEVASISATPPCIGGKRDMGPAEVGGEATQWPWSMEVTLVGEAIVCMVVSVDHTIQYLSMKGIFSFTGKPSAPVVVLDDIVDGCKERGGKQPRWWQSSLDSKK